MTLTPIAWLHEVLLQHLRAVGLPDWPGCDGLTVDDIVAYYPRAVAAGAVPDWRDLLTLHPDLDTVLHEFLTKPDRIGLNGEIVYKNTMVDAVKEKSLDRK
jgi:hypothetical protein